MQRVFRFAMVGGIGFAIEAILLSFLINVPAFGPIRGRAISFPIAVVATWWLNRTTTFHSKNEPRREVARYLLAQILGAGVNLGSYVALIYWIPKLAATPMIPFCLGAFLGLIVNFVLSKTFVFRDH